MGRPKKPEGEGRTELLRVRLTPEDLRRLQQASQHAQESLSDYVRGALLRRMLEDAESYWRPHE